MAVTGLRASLVVCSLAAMLATACGGSRPHLNPADFVRAAITYTPMESNAPTLHRTITDPAVVRSLVEAVDRLRPHPPIPRGFRATRVCAGPATGYYAKIVLFGRWWGSVTVTIQPCAGAVIGRRSYIETPLWQAVSAAMGYPAFPMLARPHGSASGPSRP